MQGVSTLSRGYSLVSLLLPVREYSTGPTGYGTPFSLHRDETKFVCQLLRFTQRRFIVTLVRGDLLDKLLRNKLAEVSYW